MLAKLFSKNRLLPSGIFNRSFSSTNTTPDIKEKDPYDNIPDIIK
jgi:hypothetical protein